ncbi:hypothetical protein DL238_12665 [Alteriqipengyuania lutimaris]|uniref:Flagellar basal body-associated FliL family protein n=1 Tax=Alteriqipengyuania lutimaris TaxID=1538146 RepID=A0A395LPM8_9SPHN|nr:hypothetical protein DL238_12665 [Alteriqipengyuania lutimaris]
MKQMILPIALLIGGVGVGGGASYATATLLGPAGGSAASSAEDGEAATTLVEVENVIAPLVLPDGQRLAGYVSFKLALQVPEEEAEDVTAHLPLLLHEINMRTYREPMASGPDGTLPTLEVFRAIVQEAADVAFDKGTVSAVAIASATPA